MEGAVGLWQIIDEHKSFDTHPMERGESMSPPFEYEWSHDYFDWQNMEEVILCQFPDPGLKRPTCLLGKPVAF